MFTLSPISCHWVWTRRGLRRSDRTVAARKVWEWDQLEWAADELFKLLLYAPHTARLQPHGEDAVYREANKFVHITLTQKNVIPRKQAHQNMSEHCSDTCNTHKLYTNNPLMCQCFVKCRRPNKVPQGKIVCIEKCSILGISCVICVRADVEGGGGALQSPASLSY